MVGAKDIFEITLFLNHYSIYSQCVNNMMKLPTNVVYLGNELFAQVELCTPPPMDEVYLRCEKLNPLGVKIQDNIITWLIPKSVFGENNYVKIKLNIFVYTDSIRMLDFDKSTDDEEEDEDDEKGFGLVMKKGAHTVRSWGNYGGDLCILKPNAAHRRHRMEHITKLHLTTFKEKIRKNTQPQRSKIACDGGYDEVDSPIPIHFATVGTSTQKFKAANFEEDESTAIFTAFHFECL